MREENVEVLEHLNPSFKHALRCNLVETPLYIYVFLTNDILQITKICLQKDDVVHVIYHLGRLGVGGVRHDLTGVNNLHSNYHY